MAYNEGHRTAIAELGTQSDRARALVDDVNPNAQAVDRLAQETVDVVTTTHRLDGFHGVSTTGGAVVHQWLPDFTAQGTVKKGEVELGPVAVVLKTNKAAAVLRNIKVQ
ncbi:hypothetical protein [Streptomyces sp. YIM S03343]